MIDMDDFKLLNDTYGHPAGDAVLRHVSEAIRTVLRHSDLAGRVGGDEMLIVLPSTGAEGAVQFSERLLETLHSSPCVTEQGMSIPVRVSLGVATFPGDTQSLAQLVEIADANLYASKQQGGDTVTSTPRSEGEPPDAHGILGVAGKLLDVVGARDHYTRRHSEHVTLYALSLGESLGLSEESLNTLHVAAMLHDVGKIGVSGHLLRRPSTPHGRRARHGTPACGHERHVSSTTCPGWPRSPKRCTPTTSTTTAAVTRGKWPETTSPCWGGSWPSPTPTPP